MSLKHPSQSIRPTPYPRSPSPHPFSTLFYPTPSNLMSSCSGQPQCYLETIINQPLECCQSSNHYNSDRQTIPKTSKSNISINPRHSLSSSLSSFSITVKFRDHNICWVRDNSTTNTSDITTKERNPSLLETRIRGLRLPQVSVDFIDGGFEGCEFHHCVRNLSTPERIESLVKSVLGAVSIHSRILGDLSQEKSKLTLRSPPL